jgi:hypothetical protein
MHCAHIVWRWELWDAWILEFGVEYPGAGDLTTETDTGVREYVVKHGREDPIEVNRK